MSPIARLLRFGFSSSVARCCVVAFWWKLFRDCCGRSCCCSPCGIGCRCPCSLLFFWEELLIVKLGPHVMLCASQFDVLALWVSCAGLSGFGPLLHKATKVRRLLLLR